MKCLHCPKMASPRTIRDHQKIHKDRYSPEAAFACHEKECLLWFRASSDLVLHQQAHAKTRKEKGKERLESLLGHGKGRTSDPFDEPLLVLSHSPLPEHCPPSQCHAHEAGTPDLPSDSQITFEDLFEWLGGEFFEEEEEEEEEFPEDTLHSPPNRLFSNIEELLIYTYFQQEGANRFSFSLFLPLHSSLPALSFFFFFLKKNHTIIKGPASEDSACSYHCFGTKG